MLPVHPPPVRDQPAADNRMLRVWLQDQTFDAAYAFQNPHDLMPAHPGDGDGVHLGRGKPFAPARQPQFDGQARATEPRSAERGRFVIDTDGPRDLTTFHEERW